MLQEARKEPNLASLVKGCKIRIQGKSEEDRSDPDIVSPGSLTQQKLTSSYSEEN